MAIRSQSSVITTFSKAKPITTLVGKALVTYRF